MSHWFWDDWYNWSNWANYSASATPNTAPAYDGVPYDPFVSESLYNGYDYATGFTFSMTSPDAGDELFIDLTGTGLTALGNQIFYNGTTLLATVSGGVDGAALVITPAVQNSGQPANFLSALVGAVRYVNDTNAEALSDTVTLTVAVNDGQVFSFNKTITTAVEASPPALSIHGENGVDGMTDPVVVNNGNLPTIAALDGGGYVVLSQVYNGVAGQYEIALTRFGEDGQALGTTTIPLLSNSDYSSVVGLEGGGFAVAYTSYTSTWDLAIQRFDSNGAAVGSPIAVDASTATDALRPSIVELSDGGLAVAFYSSASGGVVVQQYDAEGNAGPLTEIGAVGSYEEWPSLAVMNDGRLVVAYHGSPPGFQIVNADGSISAAAVAIPGIQIPEVAVLADGNIVVSWYGNGMDGSGYGIGYAIYDPSGGLVAGPSVANSVTADNQYYTSVVALADGGFAIAFMTFASSSWNVVAERFDASGARLGEPIELAVTASHEQTSPNLPSLVQLDDGNLAVVYQDSSSGVETRVVDLSPTAAAVNGMEDMPVTIPLELFWGDQDGSETLELVLSGFPAGATFSLGAAGAGGTWVINVTDPAALLTLQMTPPANYSGNFTLTAVATTTESGNGDTASDTLAFTVAIADAPNDDPVFDGPAATLTGTEDVATVITLAQLLQGYSDPDGDTMSVTGLTAASGSLVANGDGTWTLTTAANFNGDVGLTYTIEDGQGGSIAVSTNVAIAAVNDAPVTAAAPESALGNEDSVIGGTLLAGSDVESPTVTYHLVMGSSPNGTVSIDAATGAYTFTPTANYNGTTSFQYVVSDGLLTSAPKTVTVNVTPVDDAPTLVATGNAATYVEGGAAVDLFSSVSASTVDAGQSFTSLTLTVSNVTDGTNERLTFDGSVVALTNGNVVATATNGLIVSVSVVANIATLTFSGAALSAPALQTLVDGLAYHNGSQDPTDADRVITITQLVDSGASSGGNVNSSNPNVSATVDVQPVNDAPTLLVSLPDVSSAEDSALSWQFAANSFGDVDGDSLTYSATLAGGGALPAWLSFDAATRTFSGTPPLNYNGSIDVMVIASDGSLSASDTFALTITPVNDAPVASSDGVAVNEDATTANLWATLLGNDADPDAGDTLTIQSVSTAGTLGHVIFDAATQSLRYIADHDSFDGLANGATATDSFTYTVVDSHGVTSTATVTMTITGIADGISVVGTASKDTMSGTAGEDTIDGGRGNDTLYGNGGHDLLIGNLGNDRLEGGDGNDRLLGGAGDDVLVGGAGNDVFVFSGKGDNDVILDFDAFADSIRLEGVELRGSRTLDANRDGITDLMLDLGSNGSVTLYSVESIEDVHFEGSTPPGEPAPALRSMGWMDAITQTHAVATTDLFRAFDGHADHHAASQPVL